MTFWESWEQTGSETHIFIRKYQFENLILCNPRLTWSFSVVDLHGVRLQNGFDFRILRAKLTINHVPHVRFFFNLVTFRDFHDLTFTLTRTKYDIYAHMVSSLGLWGYFGWVLSKKLSILLPLGFIVQKRQKFDLWPDLDPRVEVNLKILSMLWWDLVESFRTPPHGARYDHWFLRQQEGGGSDPTSPRRSWVRK